MPTPTMGQWVQDSPGLALGPHDTGGPRQDSVRPSVKWGGHLPSAKPVKRVNPESSHYKEKIFFYFFNFVSTWNDG